jgi:HSP20 family protein
MDTSTDRESGNPNETGHGEIVGRYASHSNPLAGVDPLAVMKRMGDEMERMMRRIGVSEWLDRLDAPSFFPNLRDEIFGGRRFPQIEVFEREGELVVHVDLPGLNREDVSVDVEDDSIVIRGERRDEHEENRGRYYHSERRYGSFERRVSIPEGADLENVKAVFRDGVLEITMPAPKRASNARRVEIS